MVDILEPEVMGAFTEPERQAIYSAIRLRRDVRHFQPNQTIPDDVIDRIMGAAHMAPSVGFSQLSGFILVRDRSIREQVRSNFLSCREAESVRFPPKRREQYLSHRLEGILESSLNVCVVVDLRLQEEAILGTTVQPEAVRASACCAVQNLALAARAEGIGVGWVSIVEPAILRDLLALPAGVEPVAYLCVGTPIAFRAKPMLEETGWRARRPLTDVVHADRWVERRPVTARPPAPPAIVRAQDIPALDEAARAEALEYQAFLTKPKGSLGRLEELAVWYAAVRGQFPPPTVTKATLAVFAADHGVVADGISAYGSQLTAAMVCNVMSGGAGINALARASNVGLELIDVGVSGDLTGMPLRPVVPLRSHKVRAGTANLRLGPAMATSEAVQALGVGEQIAGEAIRAGAGIVGVGEIGIGNTTASAALICALTGGCPDEVVGPGTGVDEAVRHRKIEVVRCALQLHTSVARPPVDLLAAIGGLEIAAMVGFMMEAARQRIPVVLDGVISNAAALVAQAINPRVCDYLVASHGSPEPGARVALEKLGLRPLIDFGMRLGEGTGSTLGIHMLRTAIFAQEQMATFATAGVVGRAGMRQTG
jgi:nicotinate-nucleotide--dimethylbenzimidazole phosphoribosyltransferase